MTRPSTVLHLLRGRHGGGTKGESCARPNFRSGLLFPVQLPLTTHHTSRRRGPLRLTAQRVHTTCHSCKGTWSRPSTTSSRVSSPLGARRPSPGTTPVPGMDEETGVSRDRHRVPRLSSPPAPSGRTCTPGSPRKVHDRTGDFEHQVFFHPHRPVPTPTSDLSPSPASRSGRVDTGSQH